MPEITSQMKMTLAGLAYDCPHGKRLGGCPFLVLEHLTFKEKIVWIDQLSRAKKNQIMNFHNACAFSRENKFC